MLIYEVRYREVRISIPSKTGLERQCLLGEKRWSGPCGGAYLQPVTSRNLGWEGQTSHNH